MGTPRTISRRTFLAASIPLFLTIQILETIGCLIISHSSWFKNLGFRDGRFGGIMGGMAVGNLALANVLTDRIFKRFGLSRSGKTREERRPSTRHTEAIPEILRLLVVRLNRSASNVIAGSSLVSGVLLLVLAELVIPWRDQTGREVLPWLLGVFLLPGISFYFLRFLLLARLDEDGVYGYPTSQPFRKRFVAWDDVAACDVVTRYDTFGEAGLVPPVFKDGSGVELLRLNLADASKADRQRVVAFVRARLAKNVTGLWEE